MAFEAGPHITPNALSPAARCVLLQSACAFAQEPDINGSDALTFGVKPVSDRCVAGYAIDSGVTPEDIGMNLIELIITVCAVASPTTCEERHLTFSAQFSLRQCAMSAPPYIAQWIGQHPQWTAVKWRCEYPHTREKI